MKHFWFLIFITSTIGLYAITPFEFLSVPPPDSQVSDMIGDTLKNQNNVNDTILTKVSKIKDTLIDTAPKKSVLPNSVYFKAKDYIHFSKNDNVLHLHKGAEVNYDDIKITSGNIKIDNQANEVMAYGITDSVSTYSQKPVFTQSTHVVRPDSIRYNIKSRKAIVSNSRTKQGEFNIYNEVSKRENDSVVYMRNVRFTTSTNEENPEYYFYARKIKMVPGKKIVTGPVNMYIADVPTPLGLPFSYYPLTTTKRSGFQIPTPGQESQRGYFLQNGGYYFAISDYMDLSLLGDYYTNGSYNLTINSRYKQRYKFGGNLRLRYQNIISGERGFSDFSQQKQYNINWSHNTDSKASPNSTFKAAVNFGTSSFYRNSVNTIDTGSYLNNNLNSSISYTKTIPTNPRITLTTAATHTSNTNTEVVSLSLPNITANVAQFYPFAPKNGIKKGLLQNIRMNYSMSGRNNITTTDEEIFESNPFKNASMGVEHSIPVRTSTNLFKYFSAELSSGLKEHWVFETINQRYDSTQQEVVRDTIAGFDRYFEYNLSATLSTSVYGTYVAKSEKAKLQGIRHTIRPTLTYTYTPAFDQYYDTYIQSTQQTTVDSQGATVTNIINTPIEYSRFTGGYYGAPSNNLSRRLNFSANNTLELKLRKNKNKQDNVPMGNNAQDKDIKKLTLLRNLRVSTNYDFTRDSLKLNPISMSGNIPIITGKLDINLNATLDSYATDGVSSRINKLNIDNGGSLLRLTAGSANFSYVFSNKNKRSKKGFKQQQLNQGQMPLPAVNNPLVDEQDNFPREQGLDKPDAKNDKSKSKFYNFKVPWSLNLGYNISYNNSIGQDQITIQTLSASGDIELGPRWAVGISSGYDFVNKGVSYTRFNFTRDLESWKMTFNYVPFGNSSWNFFIGIRSSALSDIKYEKRRPTDIDL